MGIETKEKQIGENTFKINTYATGKSVGFLLRLTKVLGESIPTFFSTLASATEDYVDTTGFTDEEFANYEAGVAAKKNKAMFDGIAKAVGLIVSNLDKDNVPELIEQMVKQAQTQKNSVLVNYESDFAGNGISDLVQLLYFIIEENYAKAFLENVIKS